jgi:hypothetical protein
MSGPRVEPRDLEERFFFLTCSAEQGCGELFSFEKGGALAPARPRCGAPWLRVRTRSPGRRERGEAVRACKRSTRC